MASWCFRSAISNWEDEPGLWPVHLVGVSVSGRAPRLAGLSYYVAVANGRGTTLDDIQMSRDANSSKALLASVTFAPVMLRGAEFGGAWYRDRIPATDGEIRESDYTLSFVYERNNVEVRAEWARMTHTLVATSIDHRTSGWYVLGAWSPPGAHYKLKPYVLLDRLDVDEGETFLENAPDVSAWAAGLRWDVSRHIALKSDYRSERLGDDERSGAVRIQLALSFE